MKKGLFFSIIIVGFLIIQVSLKIWEVVYLEQIVSSSLSRVDFQSPNFFLPTAITLVTDSQFKTKIETSVFTESFYRFYWQKNGQRINFERLRKELKKLALSLESKPQNARLIFSQTDQRWQEIAPARSGTSLDIDRSLEQVAAGLVRGQVIISLVLKKQEPPITLEKVRNNQRLTLLAQGESNFAGSSNDRAENIRIGAGQFQGLAIAPGEEFSFNTWLGQVSAQAGYRAELVVKNQKLVPEYGGGLCQVSTTLFRAAILAGLPITERRGHSLPVRYYNPQGFDATIYPGITDLKFKNNTTDYLFIQSEIQDQKLSFQIYGVNDRRNVELIGPTIYEKGDDGSLKTVLIRTITQADGLASTERFYTQYKSPSLFPTERNPLE